MDQEIDQNIIENARKNGFGEEQIAIAKSTSRNAKEFIESLHQMQANQSIIINKINDDDIQQAIAASLQINTNQQIILNPIEMIRVSGTPCGLKNVGNTCYFNSLIQTYFFNRDFVQAILKWKPNQEQTNNQRYEISKQLLKNLQILFIKMIGTNKKFVDPSDVLRSICDDFGNILPLGGQKDVVEFNYYFLSRINDALSQSQQQEQRQFAQSDIYSESNWLTETQLYQSQVQHTRLLRQASIIDNKSLLSKLFFGEYQSEACSLNGAQLKQLNQQDLLTGQINSILIDVNAKTLSKGFEQYMNQIIQDGNQLILKYIWIVQPPQILSFQIQRVSYNQELAALTKQNSQFLFEKEIFIERYLKNNQQKAKQIYFNNLQLKDRLEKIENSLNQLNKFQGDKDIIEHLNQTLLFLNMQKDKENPFFIDSSDNKTTIKQIQNYLDQFKKKKENLINEKNQITKKLQASYNDLKKEKYVLQSILIHEGNPESGHYFAYIFDFEKNVWFRFNDITVAIETEDQVFTSAYGDINNSKSAYLLNYIKEEVLLQEQNITRVIRGFSISSEKPKYLNDAYGQLLNNEQREFLTKENDSFLQEIDNYKAIQSVDQIVNTYGKLFELSNEKIRQYSQQQFGEQLKPPLFTTLAVFIKSKVQNSTIDQVYKWFILDQAARQICNKGILGDNQVTELVKQQIQKNLKQYFQNDYKIPSGSIPPNDNYKKLKDEFLLTIKLSSYALYILEQYSQGNLILSIKGLQTYIKLAKQTDQQQYFFKLAQLLKEIIIFGVCCKFISKKILIQKDEILALQLVVTLQLQGHLEFKNQIFWKQLLENLIEAININHQGNEKQQIKDVLDMLKNNQKNQYLYQELDQITQDMEFYQQQFQKYYLAPNELILQDDPLYYRLIQNIDNLQNANIHKFITNQLISNQVYDAYYIANYIEQNIK